ncbi:DUF3298 and DUF4163 domain-containing protein [Kaistella polysaccharea]|uniref:DUF3298 and DUF4163 domain-containing protein n=1 Tax=Kaistella polysaccharea TaxID=2878534 RepID=UPI001CF0E05D|nr:DUF3298 and DUF4163 domain-containing protein [Kaistella polysaccharea]
MRNFIVFSFSAFIFLMGCNQKKTINTDLNAEIAPLNDSIASFVIDSVAVQDSVKITENLTAAFHSKMLVFPSLSNKRVLDSIYSVENIHLNSYSAENITDSLKAKKDKFFRDTKESIKEWNPDFKQTWTNNSNMKLFSNTNGFLTIKYTGDGFTGGAHGYYYEKYKVFDLKKNTTLQLSDILKNQNAEIWGRILMDHFLKNDLGKGQSEMLLVKEIPLNTNFYFDENNLFFLYNQYEIIAYAAGPVLIKIPLSDIKPFLNAEFKKRIAK